MDDRSFEDLMRDLRGKPRLVDVTYTGAYHTNELCPALQNTTHPVRKIPLELAEWLCYDLCRICEPDE